MDLADEPYGVGLGPLSCCVLLAETRDRESSLGQVREKEARMIGEDGIGRHRLAARCIVEDEVDLRPGGDVGERTAEGNVLSSVVR